MEVYEGEKIVQGYVVDQEMQETVVIPQAAVSAAAETTEAPLPESPWNVEAVPRPDFEAAPAYNGPRPGYAFKTGPQGLGYYVDLTRDEQFTPVVPIPMERGHWHGQTHFEGILAAFGKQQV